MLNLITSILVVTLRAGTSLVYATIGEIYTERSGVLNLGVEGMMMLGALSGFAVSYHTGNLPLAFAVAALVGGLMAALHAFITVTMRGNQVVSGLSITLAGTGLASFLGQRLGPASNNYYLAGMVAPRIAQAPIFPLSELPVVGALFNQDILTYIMYILVPLSWFYMYKTRAGLNLRAVGENPRTADAMGIDVTRVRYGYTILGGVLAGLGGAHLTLSYTPGWAENITGGRGWIVIALVIFAMWNPGRSLWGALIFGGINAIQFRLQAAGTVIPAAFLNMSPYIVTVLMLVVITVSSTARHQIGAPAALGKAYMREDK